VVSKFGLWCDSTPAYVWASVASKQSLSFGGYFINNSVYDNGSTYNFFLDQPKQTLGKLTNKQTFAPCFLCQESLLN
jgi:hypothetical protein